MLKKILMPSYYVHFNSTVYGLVFKVGRIGITIEIYMFVKEKIVLQEGKSFHNQATTYIKISVLLNKNLIQSGYGSRSTTLLNTQKRTLKWVETCSFWRLWTA
jgi:hypothetical protein